MKQFCLVNLAEHKIARDRYGKMVFHEGDQPPLEPPHPFSRTQGFAWEDIEPTPTKGHVGPPRYVMGQRHLARVHKIFNPDSENAAS